MRKATQQRIKGVEKYFSETSSLPYVFFFSLPLLLLYELLILSLNRSEWMDVRNGADVLVKWFLSLLGMEAFIGLSLALLVVLILFVFKELKKRDFHLKPAYLTGMFLESVICAVLLKYILGGVAGALHTMVAPAMLAGGRMTLIAAVVLSLGAGIYEELVFRVVLLNGLVFTFMRFIGPRARKKAVMVLAIVLGAMIFSVSHYIGPLGDHFTLSSFVQRMIAGMALSILYLWRGYGIAAWTHALYDLLIILT